MIVIDKNKCIGCGACVDDCFPMDIKMKDGTAEAANTTCIKCGHCIAVCPEEAVTLTDYDMSEVKAYDADTFDIPSEKLMNFIKFRRSVRHFKDNPIEKEKLEKVIEAGRFTPTGSNKQGVSYIVIRENVRKLTELGLKSLNALGNAILEDSSSPELLKNYGKRWKKWYQNYEENPAAETPLFGNASAVILVVSDSQIDGGLAATSMELMTHALGLGMYYSGFFVRAVSDNAELRDFVGLEDGQNVVATLVMGYPDVSYKRTVPRKEAVISWK